jgi:hypothetical protein
MQLFKNNHLYNKKDTLHNWIKNIEHYKWQLIECGLKKKLSTMIHYKIEKKTHNVTYEDQ